MPLDRGASVPSNFGTAIQGIPLFRVLLYRIIDRTNSASLLVYFTHSGACEMLARSINSAAQKCSAGLSKEERTTAAAISQYRYMTDERKQHTQHSHTQVHTFSTLLGSKRGDVRRFSTARITPSFVWMPTAVDPSLIASIAYSTCDLSKVGFLFKTL